MIAGMSESILKVRVDAPSGTIVLNRPNRRNALSRELIADIRQALMDLHQEKKVRAVILTGSAHVFCAGLDLHEIHATRTHRPEEEQLRIWQEDALAYRDLLREMLEYPKPIISAVNGPAMGGGAGLVLASDLVVAARSAEFGVPGPQRGLVAGAVAALFAFRTGGGWAANVMLSSRTVGADEAHRIGVFHELVENDMTWVRAQQLATDASRGAFQAIAMTKRMINESAGEPLGTLLATGAAMTASSQTTEAAAEGIVAFVEKREPQWP